LAENDLSVKSLFIGNPPYWGTNPDPKPDASFFGLKALAVGKPDGPDLGTPGKRAPPTGKGEELLGQQLFALLDRRRAFPRRIG